MGLYYEDGRTLKEPDPTVMLHKEKLKVNGPRNGMRYHGAQHDEATHRPWSKLMQNEQLLDIIFMVGGWTQADPSCPVEQFCPLSNEWRMMASMIHRRGDVAVCSLGGKIYTVGGHDDLTCVSNVERYDPNSNSWSKDVAHLSSPRSGVCLAEMDGHMYALGGCDGITSTNTVERYDPVLDRWTKMAAMRQPRAGAAAAVLGGFLYVVGGTDGDTPLNSVERFNPLDGTWQTCPSMLTPRERPGCAVYLGRIYVAGGRDELLLKLSTAEKFDPDTLSWTPVKRMKNKRDHVSLLVFSGKLLAIGGTDGVSNLRTIEAYNPDSNTWRHFGSMKSNHPGGQAAMLKIPTKDYI